MSAASARRHPFGHVKFSSSQTTVCQVVVNYLNQAALAARGSARKRFRNRPAACDSTRFDVHLEEAFRSGRHGRAGRAGRERRDSDDPPRAGGGLWSAASSYSPLHRPPPARGGSSPEPLSPRAAKLPRPGRCEAPSSSTRLASQPTPRWPTGKRFRAPPGRRAVQMTMTT